MEPEQSYDELFEGMDTQAGSFNDYASKNDEIMPGVVPIWYKQLAGRDIPPPSWVVDKMVPAESITIISAPPAQLKTWLALDIAISVALGKEVVGQFETKQTNVLIVDEESGAGRLRKRLQMLGVTDETPIAITSCEGFKLSEESVSSTANFCRAYGIGLVVFDSLTRLHNGDENSAKDMSVVMGDLKRLTQFGIAVIIIHHNRKTGQFGGGGGNEMRGSGDILAACDVQISVKRKAGSDILTISQNKNRDAPDLAPFDLKVNSDDDRLWFEYVGKAPKQIGKAERTNEVIRELLADGTARFQEQIIEALKGVEGVGGEKMLASCLKSLSETKEITINIGANGKHVYRLALEQADE